MKIKSAVTGKGVTIPFTGDIHEIYNATNLLHCRLGTPVSDRQVEIQVENKNEEDRFNSMMDEYALSMSYCLPPKNENIKEVETFFQFNDESPTQIFTPGIGYILLKELDDEKFPTLPEVIEEESKQDELDGIVTITDLWDIDEEGMVIEVSYPISVNSIVTTDAQFGEQYLVKEVEGNRLDLEILGDLNMRELNTKYPLAIGEKLFKIGECQ